jgi:hypothetical protein
MAAPTRRNLMLQPPRLSTQLPTRAKYAAVSVLSLAFFTENTILIDLSILHHHVYSCIMFVASPHIGIITAPRSSLIASGISWAFIRCSTIRQVRILGRFPFSSTLLSVSFQLASCILCICAFFHTSLFIPTLSRHIFIFMSWGLKLNVHACISHVYIAIHLSIYPSRYI